MLLLIVRRCKGVVVGCNVPEDGDPGSVWHMSKIWVHLVWAASVADTLQHDWLTLGIWYVSSIQQLSSESLRARLLNRLASCTL
jgi:hypothetical protein